MDIIPSYLKGLAATSWRQHRDNIHYWDHTARPNQSFVSIFNNTFQTAARRSRWLKELRNRKQRTGESVDEYVAALQELWQRVDPFTRYPEEDRLQQFLDGLRPEFIVPVASTLPTTTSDAIEKAKSIEAAFSGSAPLSAYSSLYNNTSNDRVLDQLERLTTKLSSMERQLNNQQRCPYTNFSNQNNNYRQVNRLNFSSNNDPSRSNNFSGNNQNVDTRSCYICQRTGHIA